MHLFHNENGDSPLQSQSFNSAEGKEVLVILRTRRNKWKYYVGKLYC